MLRRPLSALDPMSASDPFLAAPAETETKSRTSLGPIATDSILIALTVVAVALPFANGALAGPPGPFASLDLRYALVVGGAALALLAAGAWRAASLPSGPRRLRLALVAAGLLPIALALATPRDPLWASMITLEVLVGAPLLVLGAGWRIARAAGEHQGPRQAVVVLCVLLLIGPWVTLTWGLSQVQLMVAAVRLAHQQPLINAGEEEIEIVAADGLVVRGTYAPGRRGGAGVVVLHGIADGRTRMAGWSSLIAERGYHALRIDWRAHGRSEGSVVTFADRERLDLEAAFDWLAARDGVDRSRMLIVGASMGGGVALASTETLAPRGLRGIVAFAPPTDYGAVIETRIGGLGPLSPVARWLVGAVSHGLGHVSPLDLAPGRDLENGPSIPVLLYHGESDRSIPLELSRELADRLPNVELHVLTGVAHDDLPAAVLDDPTARNRTMHFLRRPRVRRTAAEAADDDAE
jgi:alpha-beta hydrolase superfamily lysophospholipase